MNVKKLQNITLLLLVPFTVVVITYFIRLADPTAEVSFVSIIKFMPFLWLGIVLVWITIQLFERYLPIALTETLSGKIAYHFASVILVRQLIFGLLPLPLSADYQQLGGIYKWGLVPLTIIVYTLFFHLLLQREKTLIIKNDMLQAKLRNLKMQSNPHFMLNTLSLLHYELQSSPKKAADLLLDLADLLRKNLTMSEQVMVPLFQEMEISEGFLFLQHQRFGERLDYQIETPPDCLKALVPALLLQPLIENAVKYAVAPYTRPGNISIGAKRSASKDRLHITVIDNGPGFLWHEVKLGTGLAVFKQSLELNYGQQYRLTTSKTATQFIIELDLPFTEADDNKK
ncbi:MAG: two-component system LytT family sensor kinase [Phenylobacterium sp.]|jgi:two-component system LytT family sensor kinase